MPLDAPVAGIRDHFDELVAIRRDIHAHPELGLEETRTAELVSRKLTEWGIEHVTGIGKTGIVATIKGRHPGNRSVGLRCDMDALPLTETTGLPHASTTPGKMHACGHDGHTAMLLGAARHLAGNPDFAGTVHLIFQPGEEGRGGAEAMLADGLFERFPCDAIYGMHNLPGRAFGSFHLRKGAQMAGGCAWYVTFRGTGGHGGAPHMSTDVSLAQAHFVIALHTIATRNVSALDTAVVTVGGIQGGDIAAGNVMPSEVKLSGTARYYKKNVKEAIDTRIRELAAHAAAMFSVTAEVSFNWMATPLVNHDEQVELATTAAAALSPAVDANMTPVTFGEDFSYMLEKVPGAFINIGTGESYDGKVHHVHTPLYDFNDEIIPLGIAYWAEVVKQELPLSKS